MNFKNQVAVVTGGGSGIGRAVCAQLATHGATTIVTDVDLAGAMETLRIVRGAGAGGNGEAYSCNVAKKTEVAELFKRVSDTAGPPKVLINAAGVINVATIEEATEDQWRAVLDVNLIGAFLVTQAAFRSMKANGGGTIVHIASRMAIRINRGHAAYAASKAGVLQLTQAAAFEGGPHNIRVNCVLPGYTKTPMMRGYDDSFLAGWNRVCPMGRPAAPEEIARTLLFLASDESSFVSGAALCVDGARTVT